MDAVMHCGLGFIMVCEGTTCSSYCSNHKASMMVLPRLICGSNLVLVIFCTK